MDARIDGGPVTARAGKAVEINALWIDALTRPPGCRSPASPRAPLGRARASARRASFARRFVRADGLGLLRRGRRAGGDDARVRPNQLLAVSLPTAAAADARASSTPAARALLTPLGLRSLAPDDPATGRTTAAGRRSATPPTTRARSGRG